MRILLIAPNCDGEDVGEAWFAFQWASRLALRHEVTLLTYHKRNRTPARQQLNGLRVIEWKEPPLVGRAERLNSMLAPGYLPFYWRARSWIRSALRRGECFDIIHQPVPEAMRYPCPAMGFNIPVIIGPVGGGLRSPPAFAAEEAADPWFVRLRGLDLFRLRHDPLLRRTYEGAACVLGIGSYVEESLRYLRIRRFETMADVAIEHVPLAVDRTGRTGPVRALFVGRLVRTKGVREAVRAVAMCKDLQLTLDIVGDGPDRAYCVALADELGVTDRVQFHGRKPREAIEEFYRAADVFVFPSYREPGGSVVLEAMAHGLPLIVCDRGGPSATVSDACGYKLSVTTPEALSRDVAAALRRLATDKASRLNTGRAAYEHLKKTALWDQKIDRASALYAELASLKPSA
ncbi:MAG: glycosyl transferase group 1 [Devosia sp.]|uniref:glycosyltransferase n=1 Tax=Devosia sp. TaxID=1871048 RepID=UPI00260D8208|nr:glycosyltransferase [Devosia sp.]MDB5540185.1 glycosyl transferase group 1 [Devosia sp.]